VMMRLADLEAFLARELSNDGFDPEKPKPIQDAILRLSDFYIESPDKATPWDQPWAKTAYLAYNHILGHLRLTKLFKEVERLEFLKGIVSAVDFGSGSGVSIPFLNVNVSKIISVELAPKLFEVQKRYAAVVGADVEQLTPSEFLNRHEKKVVDPKTGVLFLSFVLTEIRELPRFAVDFEALILVEPGLKNDTRRLMEMREVLIKKGYTIWAPCTHQAACPLLTHSKRDWCHDKVPVSVEGPFQKVLAGLPFDSRFASYSYLLARKSPPPQKASHPAGDRVGENSPVAIARVIGESLDENGKTRQLVCRGPNREFVSFLKKTDPNPPEFQRGEIIQWSEPFEIKGPEIRGGKPTPRG
ncbi:MAG: small ribosomal subunit Rsm22 family protein, partial [Bdellovibrionales bacterium]|nr:small ribosomal subunit Rsm22 family protein [Bdellovibrionales bacterium]